MCQVLGWPWRYDGVQCRHDPCLQNVYGLASKEMSAIILLAMWVLFVLCNKGGKSHWVALGITALDWRGKKATERLYKNAFRTEHFPTALHSYCFHEAAPPQELPISVQDLVNLLRCSRQNARNVLIPLYPFLSPPPCLVLQEILPALLAKHALDLFISWHLYCYQTHWCKPPSPLHWMTAQPPDYSACFPSSKLCL